MGLLGAGGNSDTAKIELVEDAAIQPTALELFEQETGGRVSEHVSEHVSGFFTLKQDMQGLEATYTPATVH